MHVVIIILIVIAVIIAIPLIIALFVKQEYIVQRSVTISKPKQVVFDYVKLSKNQENFSVWNMSDPNKKTESRGTDGTVGFFYAWDSKNKSTGAGEQTTKNITPGERIDWDLHFIRPMESNSVAAMTTESVGANQTKLTWIFNGKMKYPMNFMMVVLNFDKMLGKDMEASLSNLKGILEK